MPLFGKKQADAFEQLAAPCEQQVYFTCLRMVGSREDAEDCAQETMLRAFRAYSSFRGDAKFSTWLHTIATRVCMDFLRSKKGVISLDALQDAGWEKADDSPSPYLSLEESVRKELLENALQQLPDHARAAVVLCDLQGLSYEETAHALDIPVGTLRSRLSRARNALQKILSQQAELFLSTPRPIDERREYNEL